MPDSGPPPFDLGNGGPPIMSHYQAALHGDVFHQELSHATNCASPDVPVATSPPVSEAHVRHLMNSRDEPGQAVHSTQGQALPVQTAAGQPPHFEALPPPFGPQLDPRLASSGIPAAVPGHVPSQSVQPEDATTYVLDPPELQEWRQRLFDADGVIVLTNEQYNTYFPHVDNVYSHRSSQKYKRKPFVSHYYDCRLKGRPPGTPKSDDPNKKKRKRAVRELNQCDVKIKITEYFPGATLHDLDDGTYTPVNMPQSALSSGSDRRFRVLPAEANDVPTDVGRDGQKFYTIQRVNGHLSGSGIAGPHRHTLARSDEVKKNSVLRFLAKQEQAAKKIQTSRKASEAAAATIRKHSKDCDTKFFAACYCPFAQRVWIALEAKKLPYQYVEVDPSRTPLPRQLLEANPRGHSACHQARGLGLLRKHGDSRIFGRCRTANSLFPPDARLKANCRVWIDHINTMIVPSFFKVLRNVDETLRPICIEQLQRHITELVLAADEQVRQCLSCRVAGSGWGT
ncbi:conserved hypothetical protein [Verticillium alfalfae VaMs.102]|uniref:GST N-terminal domain-containing protein n=1 Tax=Verticillium alfalfae (strain VaMs.102 / ATCC MYA-4576 / FGSC 10136) TaxID=526221 RepID=C9SJY8_VERA1|nr:conserved hypothetical protein [Verticillium alfalfae VaMs.102]EEY19006.1 conserved hypothetical protein [Verticillium alfalfae VaMs.102]